MTIEIINAILQRADTFLLLFTRYVVVYEKSAVVAEQALNLQAEQLERMNNTLEEDK